jgi:hypothetical protein
MPRRDDSSRGFGQSRSGADGVLISACLVGAIEELHLGSVGGSFVH